MKKAHLYEQNMRLIQMIDTPHSKVVTLHLKRRSPDPVNMNGGIPLSHNYTGTMAR